MRSLFAKILVWFMAAMVITVAGFVFTMVHSFTASRGGGHLVGRLLSSQLEEAVHSYQAGGRERLASFLKRFENTFQSQAVLTDGKGRDLLTGADRSQLFAEAQHTFRFVRPSVLARESSGGQYWFFVLEPRTGFWYVLPEYLWIVGVVAVLALALAYYLIKPLRRLEKAVERFGRGDFAARVGSGRRDELGSLARTFDIMADRIQTLLAAERRLLLDISHELRSPLARLSVAVELARSGDDRDGALNRIEKEADRLNALVGELLQVTRAEGDPNSLRMEPLRIDDLIRDLLDDWQLEANARGCRVELKSTLPVKVRGDAELLRRAIENVVRNAIRYAPPDTVVEIAIENGSDIRVLVRDYGPGVPEQHLARIFDPFYRVDTDRNRVNGGAGLGLAIARRAVELHNGKIQARNAEPGLLVEIRLPVTAAVAAPA
jgi:signal transduction histidine kinase